LDKNKLAESTSDKIEKVQREKKEDTVIEGFKKHSDVFVEFKRVAIIFFFFFLL
jgi:hypothetical protein